MQTRIAGGRRYSDPDVVALIDASGGLLDPYAVVRQAADNLLQRLGKFEGSAEDPLERMCILASLAGYEVKAMDMTRARKEKREAILIPTQSCHKKGLILYNPLKPRPRVVHSVGHEISHSFVPTSNVGARYRSLCMEGSKISRELEALCDYGATHLTMPRADFKKTVGRVGFGLSYVDMVRREFGTSFEATLYRIASTADFPAAAGLLCFRYRKGEDPNRAKRSSGNLFTDDQQEHEQTPAKKYRRQSFHRSESFPTERVIPWNKSIPEASCVYRAAKTRGIERAREIIPLNGRAELLPCLIEAVAAPYQPPDTDPDWPDILFLLRLENRGGN